MLIADSIREQLIVLNVDIQDKIKVCKYLQERNNYERNSLKFIEGEVSADFKMLIEVSYQVQRDGNSHL